MSLPEFTHEGHELCGHCGGRAQYCNHVPRPEHGAMTIAEVAKAVGIPRRTVADHVKKGLLKSFDRPGVYQHTKHWVLRDQIPGYVKRLIKKHPSLIVKWVNQDSLAKTNGRPKQLVA